MSDDERKKRKGIWRRRTEGVADVAEAGAMGCCLLELLTVVAIVVLPVGLLVIR
jgi:hypothetical protein